MKFVAVFVIVCAAVMIIHHVEGKQKVDNARRNERIENVSKGGKNDRKDKNSKNSRKDRNGKIGFIGNNDISDEVNRNGRTDRTEEVDDNDCICKAACDLKSEKEDEHGFCCKSMKCCKPCNDTRQCIARNGECKSVCDVNEQDKGPCCNDNRCCEPPSCIASVDCTCRKDTCKKDSVDTEYVDDNGFCNGSEVCCKPCCRTCGGTFNGPVGGFTSPNYPSVYCRKQDCYYTITVEKGSKVMLNFTNFQSENRFDVVEVYDGAVRDDALLDTLSGEPTKGLEFTSSSNKMIIHFESDGNNQLPGFSAIYKTLQ